MQKGTRGSTVELYPVRLNFALEDCGDETIGEKRRGFVDDLHVCLNFGMQDERIILDGDVLVFPETRRERNENVESGSQRANPVGEPAASRTYERVRGAHFFLRSLLDVAENERLRVLISYPTVLTMIQQADVHQRRSRRTIDKGISPHPTRSTWADESERWISIDSTNGRTERLLARRNSHSHTTR